MKNILIGGLMLLVIVLTFKHCSGKNSDEISIHEHSALIQEQLKNVGKLVVTEGHFSEVYTYKNSKAIFADYFSAEKKALVVVNADVTIAYDLSLISYDIDEANKTLRINSIPEEEIKIHPEFEYYDIQDDFLNPFVAKDYNAIKETVKAQLMKKIEASDLKSNAKNRLVSELAKFYILTNSLGWTLEYNTTEIGNLETLESLKL